MADGSVIIDTKIDTSGAEKGADDIVKSLESILGYMQNISSSINKIVSSLTGGSNTASNAVSSLTDNLEATAEAGRRAVKAVSKFDPSDVSGLTIHRWNDNSDLIGDTSEISDEARKELHERAKESREAAQEEADAYNGAKEKVNELYEAIKKTKEEIKSLEKSGQWLGDEDYNQAIAKLAEYEKKAKEIKKSVVSPEIDVTSDSVSRLGEKVDSLSKKLMAAGIDGLKNKIKSIGKTIDGLVSKLLKLTSSAIIGGLQRISSGIFGIHKSANKSTLSLKNLLKYAFGIRSLFVLFNKLRSAIVTGFQNLAKYDLATKTGEVNNSLSALMSALTRLKNSFATAFAPILTTVAPILVSFINLISEAVTRVGMLIAALTGKDTFTKAIGVQENYAASLDKSSKSANKAKKATKGYLSSLDEIKRYDDGKSNTGTGSNGKYTGPSASDMFETVPIESSIKDIADKIKKYIESQDWEGLGAYMADGINKGLEKVYNVINWDNVGPKITPFITAFTETFNSLVDHIDWDLMGRTVGAGINTIVKSLNLALTRIDWYNLGKKFATGIRGIVTEVNWNEVGQLIGNKFMAAWRIFGGFVKNLPYRSIGKAVADGLNGVFNTISFSEISDYLTTAINGAFDSLDEFTKDFEWDEFAENVKNGITDFINGIEWEKNGKIFGEFLSHLCTTLKDSLTKDTFYEFGQGVGTFLGGLPWDKILTTAADLIIGGLSSAFNGLVNGIKEDHPLAGAIVDVLGKAFGVIKILQISGIGSLVEAIIGYICQKIIAEKNAELIAEKLADVIGDGTNAASEAIKGVGDVAETASTGGLTTFASTLGKIFATAGIVYVATDLSVKLAKGIAGVTEAAQGGNGILSQTGGYLHDFAGEMENAHKITQDQAEELWKLIEADESAGKSNSDMYDSFIQKLKEYGISADNARQILENYGAQAGVSADFVEQMTDKIVALGDGVSESAGKFDTTKISISDLKDELYLLSLSSDQFSGDYLTAKDALDSAISGRTYADTAEALDAVYTSLKNAGVPLDELDEKLRKDFPDAVAVMETASKSSFKEMEGSANNAMGAVSTAVGSAMSGVQTDTEKAMSEAERSVSEHTSNISSNSEINWTDAEKFATGSVEEVGRTTYENMKAVYGVVSRYNSSIKDDFDTNWGNSKSTVINAIQGMADEIERNGDRLAAGVKNAFSGIPGYITDIMNNAVGKVNNAIGNINGALGNIERGFTFTYNYTNPVTKSRGTYRSWLNLGRVNTVPYLASGAVIPPRSEFLAVLGDQKNGRNLEAPEGVIRDIINDAFDQHQQGGSGNFRFTAQINRRTVFDEMIEEAKLRRDASGTNPFELA